MKKKNIIFTLLILIIFSLASCNLTELENENILNDQIDENEYYYSKEDVSKYIYTYNKLPNNYITKEEAIDLGWISHEGNLWEVADGMVIGGDRFGNREGLLPDNKQYFEADVNYDGGFRNAQRLVYTSDGKIIYYTSDHYESFEVIYE